MAGHQMDAAIQHAAVHQSLAVGSRARLDDRQVLWRYATLTVACQSLHIAVSVLTANYKLSSVDMSVHPIRIK